MSKLFFLNPIEGITVLAILAWTGTFAYSLHDNIHNERETDHELAVTQIRSSYDYVSAFRHWIAKQGGIYVPVSNEVAPNPALAHLPERDIVTDSEKTLTLINTPYLLRQLSDSTQSSFSAHMSSLDPLNPVNQADEWERKALLKFGQGEEEFCEVVEYKNEQYMRLMRPARFETRCASCHTNSKLREGDILGGLTVSIPLAPYIHNSESMYKTIYISHASLWFIGVAGIAMVYTRQKKHHGKRKEQEQYLKQSNIAFSNLNEGIIITDADMKVMKINDAFTTITGIKKQDIEERDQLFLKDQLFGEEYFTSMIVALKTSSRWKGDLDINNKNKGLIPIHISVNPIFESQNKLTNYIFVFTDISEQKQFENKLAHLAQHDNLTGLPNRLLLNDRLKQAIIRAQREELKVAVLFLDLDHFKNINDSHGHNIGDSFLIQVANRLKEQIRKGDTLARLGGDEFIIIMERINNEQDIARLANKLITCMQPEFTIKEQKYYLGLSIGISIYPDHGESVTSLISHADIAMYQAKASGRNDYKFYTRGLTTHIRDRIKMETELHKAIENNEFTLYYQPQIGIKSDTILGVECLLRWQHPEHGLLLPEKFIHHAESIGLMLPIGEIVIELACRQMQDWLRRNIDVGIMAVNISSKQILSDSLFSYVTDTLHKYNIPPEKFELEVTEDYIMKQVESSILSLEKLRNSSIHISIDDFGTGYSSLSYLKRLPINKIKIDQSFIRDIPTDPHDRAIVNAIIAMCKSLNFRIVAEGVETQEQLDFLAKADCTKYQGNLGSKPLPAKEFELMLLERQQKLSV